MSGEMPTKTGEEVSTGASASDRKPRIAQPPYLQFREAIRIAEQIYEQGGGTADNNLLTVILKNSVSSSSFSRKLQALRLYKLTSSAVVPVSLTEVGLSIVAPKDEAARALNLKSAAIGPEVFRRSYERLKGKLLPQDEFLRNSFMHDLQLPNKVVADAWVDSFKAALETAGLLLARSDGKTQVLEGQTPPVVEPEPKGEERQELSNLLRQDVPPSLERPLDPGQGHATKITLADGRLATIFIPDRLSKRDATRLKGALVGIAAIIDSMVEEED